MKKLLPTLVASLLLSAGSSFATDYYLIGGVNRWALAQPDCKFTESLNGEYTLDYAGILTSEFKINDGSWNNGDAIWGGGGKLTIGEVYSLAVGNDTRNITMDENVKNPHIVFNPTANTLLITGQVLEPEYGYAIHGDFVPAWESKNMTNHNGVWTYTAHVNGTLNFGIRQYDKATMSQTNWFASADEKGVVQLNPSLPCKVNGTTWTMSGIGDFTFNFYPKTMTLIVKDKDETPTPPTPPDHSLASGVYFGITAFNYLPEIMPMELLTSQNKEDYKDFVNSRTTDDYTYLYYSAEQALKALKNGKYPQDLSSVTLITFTDGNDDGSLEMAPDKSWDDVDYRNYIENLIDNAKVQAIKVDAYSIGLKGNDIGEYNYDMFRSNLQVLSTAPKDRHATEVGNMKEVEKTLNEILDGLETSWLNKKVSCNINMRATGDKIRFTLDKTRDEMNFNPDNSDIWIEGVFSRDDNSMNDIVYHGCTSTSGSKVVSKKVEINGKTKYQFTFENLKDKDNNILKTGDINFWHSTSNNPVWQPHTEFAQGTDAEVETERSSAAIMFVMDCSSSLGDDFVDLKRVANDLIDRLMPDEVPTKVSDMEVLPFEPVEFYNLQGMKVSNPSYGIYIVKQGNKVSKQLFTE